MKDLEVEDVDEVSPVEQVRLTVANTDDSTLPVWTFRMWFLGLLSCSLLAFLNQFFSYRSQPLIITPIVVQVASLPLGHLLARVLPARSRWMNPGRFNVKEHVLICIFANAGAAFSFGPAYAVGVVNIVKAFYGRSISFVASWLLIITTQVLGYGWAGMMRKYVVEPAHMWWPNTLVQISLFRALHEKEEQRMSTVKFFTVALICSFTWYTIPGYLFPAITNISWLCWVFSDSVTAQQIGSGIHGIGLGAITLDWAAVASFLFSPLICPFFAIANILVGYLLLMYVAIPVAYWGFNLYNAKTFPIFSSDLFTETGQPYNITTLPSRWPTGDSIYTTPRRSPSSPPTCSRRLGNHITSPPSSTTGSRSTWQPMNSKEGSTSVCSSLSAMASASLRLQPRSHMFAFSMEGRCMRDSGLPIEGSPTSTRG